MAEAAVGMEKLWGWDNKESGFGNLYFGPVLSHEVQLLQFCLRRVFGDDVRPLRGPGMRRYLECRANCSGDGRADYARGGFDLLGRRHADGARCGASGA